jgi:uncharacterized membrane protein
MIQTKILRKLIVLVLALLFRDFFGSFRNDGDGKDCENWGIKFKVTLMNQEQLTSTQPTVTPVIPIDPTPIIQSESPSAVILAISILISVLLSSLTGLIKVLVMKRSWH